MIKLGASSFTWKVKLATTSSARPSPSGTRLKKSSNWWPVDSEPEVIGCKCAKPLPLDNSRKRKTGLQYLEALEGLRSQGFPDEPITTKRYEILQRFLEGVRHAALRRERSIIHASETHPQWNPCGSPQGNCNETDRNLHNHVIPVMS